MIFLVLVALKYMSGFSRFRWYVRLFLLNTGLWCLTLLSTIFQLYRGECFVKYNLYISEYVWRYNIFKSINEISTFYFSAIIHASMYYFVQRTIKHVLWTYKQWRAVNYKHVWHVYVMLYKTKLDRSNIVLLIWLVHFLSVHNNR